MPIAPDFPEFQRRFAASAPQLVWQHVTNDLETPVALLLKLQCAGEACFLLESVQGGETRGRYSIIGVNPDRIWRCFGERAEMSFTGRYDDEDFTPLPETSLASLAAWIAECQLPVPPDLPVMSAGLIGFLGYDMVRQVERLPAPPPDALGLPDGCFMRPRVMIVVDAVKGTMTLAAPLWRDHEFPEAAAAYEALQARLAGVVVALNAPLSAAAPAASAHAAEPQFRMTREAYHAMVERAKTHIQAGDIFQVVPSQRAQLSFDLPPHALYRALRHLNPSPFLFFLQFGAFSLIGSSPEILVRLREGTVTIRPLAGTRKRGATPAEDAALADELLADPKETAEHLMLLDLGRNDVGRVTEPGSVRVTERMIIERYSHVMHIVSNVEGKILPGKTAFEALLAGFPAGTVSGAPKIRAMEIIDTLEREKRGFYGGCVGYFAADGSMDTCITLRTALLKDGVLYAQAGGGVVLGSDPEAEYQESCNKMRAILRAAEEAGRFV